MIAQSEPRRRLAGTRGVRISWVDWHGDGSPVLAIHGITANARAFDGLARALAPMHPVLAMDLRGRGESDTPPDGYDVETHVSDAVAVLDAGKVGRCDIVGWSLGGKVALAMAALHPSRVRRIIVLDPPLATPDAARHTLRQFWKRLSLTYPSVDAYVERMTSTPLFGGRSEALEAYLRADVRRDPDGVVRHRVRPWVPELELASEEIWPTAAYLPRVKCPTLILRSTEPITEAGDAVLSRGDAEALAGGLRWARLLELEGSNHFGMLLRDPPPTAAPIAAFLAEPEPE